MSLVLVGSTSGSITLQEPAVAGTTTINLPATSGTALVAPTALTVPNTTGTVMVSGNMPAFSAYVGTTQNFSSNTTTLAQINTKEFDTNTCFNNTGSTTTLNGISVPAYSFAPNVAGYYKVSAGLSLQSNGTGTNLISWLYKNGSAWKQGNQFNNGGSNDATLVTACLVYMNGTSDYINMYVRSSNSSYISDGGSPFYVYSHFSAAMVRGA